TDRKKNNGQLRNGGSRPAKVIRPLVNGTSSAAHHGCQPLRDVLQGFRLHVQFLDRRSSLLRVGRGVLRDRFHLGDGFAHLFGASRLLLAAQVPLVRQHLHLRRFLGNGPNRGGHLIHPPLAVVRLANRFLDQRGRILGRL